MANILDIRLTPWDGELCMMVESLTGKPCKPKNGGTHYFIEVDYSLHDEPEYINAIYEAIAGRIGERLIKITDDPDAKRLIARIKFHPTSYPKLFTGNDSGIAYIYRGFPYTDGKDEVWALQVTWDNCERLFDFVGGGEMEVAEDGKISFHFLNAYKSVYAHVMENFYIVHDSHCHFHIEKPEEFEAKYTIKKRTDVGKP